MKEILIVAAGGALGAVCRYLTGIWAAAQYGTRFPYGTLIVNITGCFIIGLFMTIINERIIERGIISSYGRLLIVTGFLGALTTFSAYSYETFKLIQEGELAYAFYNIAANLVLGFFAAWVGIMAARLV